MFEKGGLGLPFGREAFGGKVPSRALVLTLSDPSMQFRSRVLSPSLRLTDRRRPADNPVKSALRDTHSAPASLCWDAHVVASPPCACHYFMRRLAPGTHRTCIIQQTALKKKKGKKKRTAIKAGKVLPRTVNRQSPPLLCLGFEWRMR